MAPPQHPDRDSSESDPVIDHGDARLARDYRAALAIAAARLLDVERAIDEGLPPRSDN